MLILGPLGFATPWLLALLAALPVLWVILRAVPPAPKVLRFPGTRLLMGLRDRDAVAHRTPWWLLLLRILAIAAAILAFAGPVWKPAPMQDDDRPLLVVLDAGWAAAPDWPARLNRAAGEVERAGAAGQPVALLVADGREDGALPFVSGSELTGRLRALQPAPWNTIYPPDPDESLAAAPDGGLRTLWLSDGLDRAGRAEWLAALRARGPVSVVTPAAPVQSLELVDGPRPSLIHRATGPVPDPVIRAVGPDPQGVLRELARLTPSDAVGEAGIATRPVPIDLPSELRNRITRFEIASTPSAGAVVLADDRVRRRKVALVGDDRAGEGQELLSPMHYLREAISPHHDLISGGLPDVLQAAPDVIVMVDQLVGDSGALEEWVRDGGLLIRFAGPRMAASAQLDADPLLPVRLRIGGRDVGGALSWGEPRGIADFDGNGPFAGLVPPADVTVRAQLLPQPLPEVESAIIARLSDQTPLATREAMDQGQIVLVHTTANAEWTNLPLSGLFVGMLDRLIHSARNAEALADRDTAEDVIWVPEDVLDGFGRDIPAEGVNPVPAADFAAGAGPQAPPGVYLAGERRASLNAGGALALPDWTGAQVQGPQAAPGVLLMKWLLAAAALILALDALGSAHLARGGRRAEVR